MLYYKNITIEDIQKAIKEFFDKEPKSKFDVTIIDISDTHLEIRGRGILGIISKELWEKCLKESIGSKISKPLDEL